jgi:hypothetical protein
MRIRTRVLAVCDSAVRIGAAKDAVTVTTGAGGGQAGTSRGAEVDAVGVVSAVGGNTNAKV